MREQPKISNKYLRACLHDEYGLNSVTLDFLPAGLDSDSGLYRVVSDSGACYLLKIKAGSFYEPSCLVPGYLKDHGISSVVAPIPARRHALWTEVKHWTVVLYPFIDGDSSWTGMTAEQWKQVGTIFRQVHQVQLPPSGFATLRKDSFDPAEYSRCVEDFEAQHPHSQAQVSPAARAMLSSWKAHEPMIHEVLASLNKLAGALKRRRRTLPYVICHGDLHPANLLRDRAGQVFVIDWDDVLLAPKERDFIFVGNAPSTGAGSSPFFAGYGDAEIDWVALAYYRYERVAQNLIAYAQQVFFRPDLSERSKADAVRLFQEVLAEGNELDVASRTAAAVPPGLFG